MTASDRKESAARGTQRERLEHRERAILAAATELFSQQGVDGTRMAQIAQAAQVAEGTLYLYYRNKKDLLAGVVGHFWQQLTAGAQAAIDDQAPVLLQLRQLGRYHLYAVRDQLNVVELTYRARHTGGAVSADIDQIRGYVRVFDHCVQRGIDRGELLDTPPLWQLRDVFYGTLEFSARSMALRGAARDDTVVENLIKLFECYRPQIDGARQASEVTNADLLRELRALRAELR